jgi:hypothetical protein
VLLKRSVVIRCNSASGLSRNASCIAQQCCLRHRAIVGHHVAAGGDGEIRAFSLAVDFREQVVKGTTFRPAIS